MPNGKIRRNRKDKIMKLVYYAYNCDTGEVVKAGRKKDEIEKYVQGRVECVGKKLDLDTVEEDDEQEIRYDGLTRMVPVQDILEALDYETEDEEIDLDDGPTPDEEEDACKAYGLKKPE